MQRNVWRCVRIIEDLLEFSRKNQPAPSRLVLSEWIGQQLAEMPGLDGMRVRREITPGTVVHGDPERLRQAFVNVLHNAIQAVEAGQPDGGGEVVIRSRREGKDIVLSVSDNGCGTSAEVAGRMFEPLFSTKAFGVGLGMPLVKRIVEQHGGAVAVESEPGRGTTVVMRLPRYQREGDPEQQVA